MTESAAGLEQARGNIEFLQHLSLCTMVWVQRDGGVRGLDRSGREEASAVFKFSNPRVRWTTAGQAVSMGPP